MMRMTKQADYGIVLMTHFAVDPTRQVQNARDLARKAHLPQPTVTKVLKGLTRNGLLNSQRGVKGGYQLAREPEEISVAEIIAALEGPIAITQCSEQGAHCNQETFCPVRDNWRLLDRIVRTSLEGVSLAEMARPMSPDELTGVEQRVLRKTSAVARRSLNVTRPRDPFTALVEQGTG